MSEKYTQIVKLDELNNGAITELFDREFPKLLNNLADENTSWKVGRELTIKVKVKLLSEERSSAASSVDVALKTAPPKPHEQIISLDSDGRNVHAYARKEDKQLEMENIENIEDHQEAK